MDDWHTISPATPEQVPEDLPGSSINQPEKPAASQIDTDTGAMIVGALSGIGKAPPPVISSRARWQSERLAVVRPRKRAFDLQVAVVSARRYNMNWRLPEIPVMKYLLSWRTAVIVLCVLLVGGIGMGVVFAINSSHQTPAVVHPASSATVTITPDSKTLQNNFTIAAVTGTPNQGQHQIQIQTVTGTRRQSATANTTGQGTTPATNASGTVTLTNFSSTGTLNIQAGTLLTDNINNQGFGTVIDQAVNIGTATMVNGRPQNPIQTVNAHAAAVGAAGNINVNGFGYQTGPCGSTNPICWSATNLVPFTGGANARNFRVVQQSDIDGAAGQLQAQVPNPTQVLQTGLAANEQLINTTPHCNSVTGHNRNVGDTAANVTVTITYTCSGEAFDKGAATNMAVQELKDQAATNPGQNYALQGTISATVQDAQPPDNNGMTNITVAATGMWVFQLSDAMKQEMASTMVGKQKTAILNSLKKQTGVKDAVIQLSGGDQKTFPANPQKITITVQPAVGQ